MAKQTISLGGLVVLLLALVGEASAQDLHFEVGALYWDRGDNRRSFDYIGDPAVILDPAASLRFGEEWGQRYRLFRDNGKWEIEGVYTRFDDWSSAAGGTFVNGLSFDLDPAGGQIPLSFVTAIGQAAVQEEEGFGATRINTAEQLVPGSTFTSMYESQWNDAELNLKILVPGTTWLKFGLGARYGNLDEFFNLDVFGTFDDTPLGDNNTKELTNESLTSTTGVLANVNDTVVGGGLTLIAGGATGFQGDMVAGAAATASILDIHYDANVQNNLVGAQMILQALLWEDRLFVIEGWAKGGVFHNRIDVTLTESYREINLDFSTYRRIYADSTDVVAFLGNVYLAAGVKLRESVRVKFGYEVQFLSGVALAAEQWQHVRADSFGRASFTADATGTIISHGGNGSLEILW